MSPNLRSSYFLGFLKCSIFNYVFKKKFTPAHMGRFTLPADPKSNPEHRFEHYANSKSRKDNPYENI